MALKCDRKYVIGTDISFFMNEASERGIVVGFDNSTTGSPTMDDPGNSVNIPTGVNALPAGILVNDVVAGDPSSQCRNFHKDEVWVCSKVTILRNGYIVTNMLAAGITPMPGQAAYFTAGGLLTNVAGSASVGTFLSSKDADGYAKVDVTVGS